MGNPSTALSFLQISSTNEWGALIDSGAGNFFKKVSRPTFIWELWIHMGISVPGKTWDAMLAFFQSLLKCVKFLLLMKLECLLIDILLCFGSISFKRYVWNAYIYCAISFGFFSIVQYAILKWWYPIISYIFKYFFEKFHKLVFPSPFSCFSYNAVKWFPLC